MTCASLILEHYVPDSDATIVTRMLDEGAEVKRDSQPGQFRVFGSGGYQRVWPDAEPAQH